ncbi:hypothetical protein BH09GEM1_BH09GEM1_06470 [soil metagenome]
MRLNFRVAAAVAFILGATSCSSATDGLTGSQASAVTQARLAINPSFSPVAAQAFSALVANGADITNIHIVLTDLGGRVTLDTVVAFPIGKDTISIDLPLDIQGREQQFNAQIDLRDAAGVVQFSIRQIVTARSSSLPPAPQTPFVLQYVGPGSTAKTVAVSPGDGTLIPKATTGLIATAADAGGVPIGDLAVVWSSSDTTIVRIVATGPGTATATAVGPRGTATITAKTLSGVGGTSKLTVVPVAAGLTVFSGGGQSSAALDTLGTPFTVELRGTDGGIMSGVLVTFSGVTSGGSVVTTNTSTDATGRASTRLVLGRTPGTYSYQAVAGGLAPVSVSATATVSPPGPASQLVPLTALPSSFKAGVASTQKFSAQLADAKGYYVAKSGVVLTATLEVTSSSGAKSTKTVTATSNSEGVLTLSIPAFDTTGSVLITLTVPNIGLTLSGTFTIS